MSFDRSELIRNFNENAWDWFVLGFLTCASVIGLL
jgi:hypothetical protein